jgi:tetratricopeptide (TPR) repeat protein
LHFSFCILHFLLGALLVPRGALADGAAWADNNFPVRRLVTVEAKLTPGNVGGDEVGVAEIPTDKLASIDGHDIRVANAAGRWAPMQLLSVGPGSTARVAFAVQPGRNTYAIYYGNLAVAALPKEQQLAIRRGLLLETCTFVEGDINGYDSTLGAFKRSRDAGFRQGADFVGNVFQGCNLFGPSGRTITRYTGFLQITAAGEYGFATSSTDASFLCIDGKVVIGWPGHHGWIADARHSKTVPLAAGVHEFDYLHANKAADGGCVAAWMPPGAHGWLAIPDTAFLPVFRATPGPREQFGTMRAAEMTWQHGGEASIGGNDQYLQRYRFTSQPAGFDAKIANFTWDFGDGLSASGAGMSDCEHVYLSDGPVDVTVTITQGTLREKVTNRVVVARPWRALVTENLDGLADYLARIKSYDFASLKPDSIVRAMEVFNDRPKFAAAYLKAGHALVATSQPIDDALLMTHFPEYVERLRESGPGSQGPAAAVAEYQSAGRRAKAPFTRASMAVWAGRVQFHSLGDDRAAEQSFRDALKFADWGADRSIKAAWIGLGDVFRRRGDSAKALDAYRTAEAMLKTESVNQAAVEVGSLARTAEYYIRQGDFEQARKRLDEWDWQFPTHKLQGYSTLMWVKFYQAQKLHREAIAEAADLVAAGEQSNYAPQLLIAAAESWLALGEKAKAKQLLEQVVAVYKDSPLVADAKKKLADLGK